VKVADTVSVHPDVVFADDFSSYPSGSDGRPAWLPVSGDWRVAWGRYEQTEFRYSGVLSFLTGPVLADLDYSFRFKVKPDGLGVKAAGIVFRSQDSASFYYAHLDSKSSQVIIVKSAPKKPWTVLKRAGGIPIKADEWHTARAVCIGPKIQIFLDGRKVAEAEDGSYKSGKVGLRAGQGRIYFDDVRVVGTRGTLEKEWKIMPESAVDSDLKAHRLEKARRVLAVTSGGFFPVLIKLKNGDLLAVVRGGAPHVGVGGRLDVIRSKDGGKTWSKPRTVADEPPDARNPAFGQAADGRVILLYSVTGPYVDGKFVSGKTTHYTLWLRTSEDNGETWSGPKPIPVIGGKYASPFGKIVRLKDGTLLAAVYVWDLEPAPTAKPSPGKKAAHASFAYRSTDNGKTWGDASVIGEGFNETALCVMPDDRVIAMMRSDGLSRTESTDGGRTWTAPKTVTGKSRHPADLIRLSNGHLLLTYGFRILPHGVQAVLSRDGGATWDHDHRTMIEWESVNTDCGYPSSAQLDDGAIVTLHYGVENRGYPGVRQYTMCVRYKEADLPGGK
jgi:hypothetical protein